MTGSGASGVRVWLVLTVLAGRVAPLAAQAPAEGPEVAEVRFPGARGLSPAFLATAVATQPSRCRSPLFAPFCLIGDFGWAEQTVRLDRAEVDRDVERLVSLYREWGYPDATVTAGIFPEGDEVAVEFRITEGAPLLVGSIEVRGLEALDRPLRLPAELPLEVGEPYALPRLEATQLLIQDSLAERGRPFAQVVVGGSVDGAARQAAVVLTVEPGPVAVFGETEVRADPPIGRGVVRERLAYRPGERFNPGALERTEARLRDLPIVAEADARATVGTRADTVVEMTVAVSAARRTGVGVEGTLSSARCLEVGGVWGDRYFLGGSRMFSVAVGFSNLGANALGGDVPCGGTGEEGYEDPDYYLRAELLQPWPGGAPTAVRFVGFYERESVPRAFVSRSYGGGATLLHRRSPEMVGTLGYTALRTALDAADFFFCVDTGACSAAALGDVTGYGWLSPVEAGLAWQRLPGPPPPERAYAPWSPPWPVWRTWARADLSGAGNPTGSDYDYVRASGEGAATRLFGLRVELAGRLRLGAVADRGDVLPPQVRFYSGGVASVRGVAQNLLGPRVLVASGEALDRLGCAVPVPGCAGTGPIDPDLVSVRPVGGEAVAEASIEARFQTTRTLRLAAFVDFGAVRRFLGDAPAGALEVDGSDVLATPGVGVRVSSPLGPLRIDVAYDPRGAETLQLLARTAAGDFVPLGPVIYDPTGAGDAGAFTRFLRRLQVQIGIGEAF